MDDVRSVNALVVAPPLRGGCPRPHAPPAYSRRRCAAAVLALQATATATKSVPLRGSVFLAAAALSAAIGRPTPIGVDAAYSGSLRPPCCVSLRYCASHTLCRWRRPATLGHPPRSVGGCQQGRDGGAIRRAAASSKCKLRFTNVNCRSSRGVSVALNG